MDFSLTKIAVYGICLNEEKFVERWLNTADEADIIIVGDTGSNDKTKELLLKNPKVSLYDISIKPFRFDLARNSILNLIPNDFDICVSLDFDEYFEKGWREKLEKSWKKDATRLSYLYQWSENENDYLIQANKIHARHLYYWKNPVHEVLKIKNNNEKIEFSDFKMYHKGDHQKSRDQYRELLEISYKENKDDPAVVNWLARVLFYENDERCVNLFKEFLNLNGTDIEKASAMVCLSKFEKTEYWLQNAILVLPTFKTSRIELLKFYYQSERWFDCIQVFEAIHEKTDKRNMYLDTIYPDELIYDLASLAYFNLGKKYEAHIACLKAIEKNPYDDRLKNNLKFFENE